MLTNSRSNNSSPLASCSCSISRSEKSQDESNAEKQLLSWGEKRSYPRMCILAQHISNPDWCWEIWSGENQYILLDAGKGRYESGSLFELCNWLWERRETSLASSSWEQSRLNHRVRVSLSPSVICQGSN